MLLRPEDVANVDWNNAMFHPAVRDAVTMLVLDAIGRADKDNPCGVLDLLKNAIAVAAVAHQIKK